MNDFARPSSGFRFAFGGMKLNAAPNSLAPDKYNLAVNVRAYGPDNIRTRPGQVQKFTTGAGLAIINARAYAAISTDDLPRYLVVDKANTVYLDNGSSVGSVGFGGFSDIGASMIPFRPNASPAPWMYVSTRLAAYKFSAPSATNVVVAQKVGIAEPQTAPGVAFPGFNFTGVYTQYGSPTLTPAGTAGATSSQTRVNDTALATFADPAAVSGNLTIQVGSSAIYQRFMSIIIGTGVGTGTLYCVTDVYQPLPTSLNISGIYYFSGTTGHCIIVPDNLSAGPGTSGESLFSQQYLPSLRRGALIKVGTEVCYIWSVTEGPDGTVAIETSTTSNHTTSDLLSGVSAIQILGNAIGGTVISSTDAQSTVTSGIGTLTAAFSTNPFIYSGGSYQPDDYLHLSINVDNLANLNEIKLLIDVGDGSFTQNFYYYTIRPADIQSGVNNTLTQLAAVQEVIQRATIDEEEAAAANNQGTTASSAQTVPGSGQWSEIFFPISALTRVGNDQSLTLENAGKWQVLVNANASVIVQVNGFSVIGGFGPDVGDVGSPYLYRVRPRSQLTGAVGNPSPATRYGVSPRRGFVPIYLPSAAYDSQIDTWDIFRYGGSVTSWRYVGSCPSTTAVFDDTYDDSAVGAGEALDFDNFEPWPTVYVPHMGTASQVCGTIAVVSTTGDPDLGITMPRFLPGTLVQLGGQNVYTLAQRPITLGVNSFLFQFVENAGAGTSVPWTIQEPALANQLLPYWWGPDADGTVFAVGDQYRPGTVNFTKNNAPDSVPDTYNIEITPPSEPLMGGIIVDGLSFVGSSERWWALYPQPDNPAQRFNFVQTSDLRGIAAPFGICTDGQSRYWWAKDGIWSSTKGSLTDADLSSLFPREGIVGRNIVYNGTTIYAPDYSRVATFRLAYANNYLYATYQDSTGVYRTLVCDTRTVAWSTDVYSPTVSCFYHPEQEAGSTSGTPSRYDELIMGTSTGVVAVQTELKDDLSSLITSVLATFEFDGGDLRAQKQWTDLFIDCIPAAQYTPLVLSLISEGANFTGGIGIPGAPSTARTRLPLDLSQVRVKDFCGLYATWTDDFAAGQTVPTRLYAWQPSFVVQPAAGVAWYTFGTTFSLEGFMHIPAMLVAWVSTAPITLTITTFDGQSPSAITIPSSGGAYQKAFFRLSANKGLIYKFTAQSSAPFQFFLDDFEIKVGAWGRTGPYLTAKKLIESQSIAGVA